MAMSPSSAAGADVVPVSKPADMSKKTSPSYAAGSNVKIDRPQLPAEKESAHCDIEALMMSIYRYCEQQLPAAIEICPGLAGMCENRAFWECLPLAIGKTDDGSFAGAV